MAIESGVCKSAFNGLAKRVRLIQEKLDLLEAKHSAGDRCPQIPVEISLHDALFGTCHSFAPGIWVPLMTQVMQISRQKRVSFAEVDETVEYDPNQASDPTSVMATDVPTRKSPGDANEQVEVVTIPPDGTVDAEAVCDSVPVCASCEEDPREEEDYREADMRDDYSEEKYPTGDEGEGAKAGRTLPSGWGSSCNCATCCCQRLKNELGVTEGKTTERRTSKESWDENLNENEVRSIVGTWWSGPDAFTISETGSTGKLAFKSVYCDEQGRFEAEIMGDVVEEQGGHDGWQWRAEVTVCAWECCPTSAMVQFRWDQDTHGDLQLRKQFADEREWRPTETYRCMNQQQVQQLMQQKRREWQQQRDLQECKERRTPREGEDEEEEEEDDEYGPQVQYDQADMYDEYLEMCEEEDEEEGDEEEVEEEQDAFAAFQALFGRST